MTSVTSQTPDNPEVGGRWWWGALGLGLLCSLHAAPVALFCMVLGAPWWIAVPVGLAGGLVLGDLTGGVLAWLILEAVGIDSWPMLVVGAGVGAAIWSGLCTMVQVAVFALSQVRIKAPALLRWRRRTDLQNRE